MTFTAGDAANDHEFDNSSGKVLLLMKNTHTAQQTATVVSVADPYGRTGDKTITAGIGSVTTKVCMYGPFAKEAFNQSSGKINVDLADATGVSFAAVKLPA